MNSGGFTLTVAGSNIPERLRRLARPGLLFLSDVDDLTELYERARLFVAPTRYAAGIPIKLLDAAAHGLPIVCSDLLAEQLGWHDGSELLAAPDSAGFAAATARVYSDEALWNALRAAALKRVVTEFNPDNFRETLGVALNTVLSPRQ
jgi:glycosyltransferase involved in cell wall biosynthesis